MRLAPVSACVLALASACATGSIAGPSKDWPFDRGSLPGKRSREAAQRAASRRRAKGVAGPPAFKDGAIAIRWLGTAGFEVRTAEGVLLFDPFLTRPSSATVALGHLAPDEEALRTLLPDATAILIGHSHFDHLLDAPSIAARTGATLAGTRTTCLAARALGLPEAQCVVARSRMRIGPFDVEAIPSEHSRIPVIGVPFPGALDRVPKWRYPHASEMPMGGALIWVVRTAGLTIVHVSSAGLPPDASVLRKQVPEGADLLLCAIGARSETPGYARTLITELRPRLVIPIHWDHFTGPLEAHPDRRDAEAFAREAEGASVRIVEPLEPIAIDAAALEARPRAALSGALR